MLRHFDIGDELIAPQAWRNNQPSGEARRHPLGAFQFGRVCVDCNGGWMSRLEQAAKPLLLPLSAGERRLADLTHKEQRVLWLWASKTALVLHAATYSDPVIPRTTYAHLRNRSKQLEEKLTVVAMITPDLADDIRAVSAIQSNRFLVFRPPVVSIQSPGWKISLRIGILQLLVAYRLDTKWTPVGWQEVHAPLWPSKLPLRYSAGLRRDHVTVRKESGTVLFHVSLGMAKDVSQQDIGILTRPPLEEELERFFATFRK